MSDIKQVKVDNWGIFFLQRLQQFFNRTDFCDLTLQFENNVQLKVHRLVMNACTEYFQTLENTCDIIDDCLVMPINLQPDVVVPIVNFMYTGQLEFQMSNFDKLYATAKLMNMTVLTKLLDAQKVPVSPLPKPVNKKGPVGPVTWNLQGKKILAKTMDPDLPVPLPGRKLPLWKRKTPPVGTYRSDATTFIPESLPSYKTIPSKPVDDTPRPTRFEWPEDDVPTSVISSFDDISYGSQPLVTPIKEEVTQVSSAFEEIKRTAQTLKRPQSDSNREPKRLNLQEVKEYLQEHRLRTDYILKNDGRASPTEDSNDDDYGYVNENYDESGSEVIFDNVRDETPNKSILKPTVDECPTPSKKVRFSLEGKENATSKPFKKVIETTVKSDSPDEHKKIISQVLKRYPDLVKKPGSIKLKIMQKHLSRLQNKSESSKAKQINYVVRQESKGETSSNAVHKKAGKNTTAYGCATCNIPNEYLELKTYQEYHSHLLEFHPEKVDSRVCSYCGHKCAQYNILAYHMYVKHGIEPTGTKKFPKCQTCDFIAFNTMALNKHMDSHLVDVKCNDCRHISPSYIDFIKHSHRSGHNQNLNFDCQYCHKKFLRTVNVITHMRLHHIEEYEREGLMNLTKETKEDIKILSDVKIDSNVMQDNDLTLAVKGDAEIGTTAQVIGPSSEAEALNNVASGIAASLGLVDTIVVLDENQFVLHSTEEIPQTSGCDEQFILPAMSGEEINAQTPQTIALSVSEQNSIISQASIISNTTMTSTDELVMVLTDHDYSDGSNSLITPENSNIVVLYSHPVDGQPTQYISQQGNILLNSQTGMIEMNGHKLQVTNADELQLQQEQLLGDDRKSEPEESIEMIQQEINNHLNAERNETNCSNVASYSAVQSSEPKETQDSNIQILSEDITDKSNVAENDIPALNDISDSTESQQTVNCDPATNVSSQDESIAEGEKMLDVDSNSGLEPMEIDEPVENLEAEIQQKEDEAIQEKNQVENSIEDNVTPICEESEIADITLTTIADLNSENHIEEAGRTENIVESMDQDDSEKVSNTELVSSESMEMETDQMNEISIPNIIPENPETHEITNRSEGDENADTDKTASSNPTDLNYIPKDENSTSGAKQEDTDEVDSATPEVTELLLEKDPILNSNEVGSQQGDVESGTINLNTESILTDLTDDNINEDVSSETPPLVLSDDENVTRDQTNTCENHNEPTQIAPPETAEVPESLVDQVETEVQNESKSTVETSSGVDLQIEDTNKIADEAPHNTSKDNVTSLVSDWCDDDSALQANETDCLDTQPMEEVNEVNEKVNISPNLEVTQEENIKEPKLSNLKITKLLDDWDDGDTDSQNSGEPSQQAAKNPINNLIDDWEDDD